VILPHFRTPKIKTDMREFVSEKFDEFKIVMKLALFRVSPKDISIEIVVKHNGWLELALFEHFREYLQCGCNLLVEFIKVLKVGDPIVRCEDWMYFVIQHLMVFRYSGVTVAVLCVEVLVRRVVNKQNKQYFQVNLN
jgi:hypothetical protein